MIMKKVAPKLLHELFDISATRFPASIAIYAPSKCFTYQKLASLSNQFAQRLIDLKVKPNQLVAIVMEKGWEQVVAVLGILKSGAAYLPIDPNESRERLHYLLSVGEVEVVLTQSKYANCLCWPQNKKIITVESSSIVNDISFIEINIETKQTENDLAYVVFTSGSTGTPKGVMITHKNAINTIIDINERFSVDSSDKCLAISDLTFDLSVYDIFGPLAKGGTIVFMDTINAKDPTQWDQLIFKEKISIWNSVPVLMNMFVEHLSRYPKIPQHSLRLILLSGDWIPVTLPDRIRALFGNITIISLGGATEGSIWSILYPIHRVDPIWKSIPYGKAMKNQSFHILDEQLNPVEKDKKGELFIGGVGVAQGYWRDPERTNAQFIQHSSLGRLYKTGDLGQYLADGNIEFLGRVDFQVKIAGYRVEVNAIEKHLLDFSNIKQAVVQPVQEAQHQKLVAYIALNQQFLLENENAAEFELAQINHWKTIYNDLYQEDKCKKNKDKTFNTTGWVSSYIHESIPNIQMREWVNNTVKRILLLEPKFVLEIGCGTGLLLFSLFNKVIQYDATDFSENSIRIINEQLERLNIENVSLFSAEAKEMDILTKNYDTIILNSVIQYFPSINYLVDILSKCIKNIKSKGHIFIGDVRSLQHLDLFHASILFNSQAEKLNHSDWKALVNNTVEGDSELVVDFNFFHALRKENSRISHIEILLKEGKFQNEMNAFRYDVILYIDHEIEEAKEVIVWKDWRQEGFNLKELHHLLSERVMEYIAIKNIPNKRVINFDRIIHNNTINRADCFNFSKKIILKNKNNAIDPALIYEMANTHQYYSSITWAEENAVECFDIFLRRKPTTGLVSRGYLCFLQKNIRFSTSSYQVYANKPFIPRVTRQFIDNIKIFLRSKLPHYMVPSYYFILKELPVNINGKIDRKALPKLLLHSSKREHYIAPRTSIQKKLVDIWGKILGANKISIRHSFYELGGTSILIIQLLGEIYEAFGIKLSIHNIIDNAPTIEKLSELLEHREKLYLKQVAH